MENLDERLELIQRQIEELVTFDVQGVDIEVDINAEKVIAQILKLKQLLQTVEDKIDNQIKALALTNPQKMGYEGQYIRLVIAPRVNYRITGTVPGRFLKTEQVLDKKKVEAYIDTVGKVPAGITKVISISVTKKLL